MRDDIPTLLRDAAADPSHTPDFDALADHGRRQHLAARAGTALVAVVALVAGGIVLWPDSQPARAPVIGDQPTTPDQAEQPVTLPDGWHEIEVRDATFGVPGDWVLEVFNEPADLCVNNLQEPTAVVMHAGPVPETTCTDQGMAARVLQTAPLSTVPSAWLDPPAGEQWRTATTGDVSGQVLVRNGQGTSIAYRFPTLDLWLQFSAPEPIGSWADEILSTLVASSGAVPNDQASPFDPAAQMRPDLMEARPASAVPGDTVELVFPQETPRGVAFVLEGRSGERWDWRYVLTSSPLGSQREPAWWPADEHEGWEDLGVGGPGPDLVVIPDTASPGDYRICTANAGDEFCTPVRIDAQGPSSAPAELEPGVFVSDSVASAGGERGLFEETEVVVEVSLVAGEPWVSWRAACNTAGAPARLDDGHLGLTDDVTSTAMACENQHETEQDEWLSEFFTNEPLWARDGDQLRVRSTGDPSELVLTTRPDTEP